MKRERPIIFSGPMVRAILDGRKTVTRRVAKLNCAGRVALRGLQELLAGAIVGPVAGMVKLPSNAEITGARRASGSLTG